LEAARNKEPNIDKILANLELTDWVTVYYEPRSFTWRLMKFIEEGSYPRFDFCYLDGGHTWDVSGFGFFLVEKLLRPGGWLLFDDLNWSVAPRAEVLRQNGMPLPPWMARMTDEEMKTLQVRKVWELLVKQHMNFDKFLEEGQWGFTRKKGQLSHAKSVRKTSRAAAPCGAEKQGTVARKAGEQVDQTNITRAKKDKANEGPSRAARGSRSKVGSRKKKS
jgi:hypothetical protein